MELEGGDNACYALLPQVFVRTCACLIHGTLVYAHFTWVQYDFTNTSSTWEMKFNLGSAAFSLLGCIIFDFFSNKSNRLWFTVKQSRFICLLEKWAAPVVSWIQTDKRTTYTGNYYDVFVNQSQWGSTTFRSSIITTQLSLDKVCFSELRNPCCIYCIQLNRYVLLIDQYVSLNCGYHGCVNIYNTTRWRIIVIILWQKCQFNFDDVLNNVLMTLYK